MDLNILIMQCTISGSFRKFYQEICRAYDIFEKNGICVLSPRRSKVINPKDEFVRLESDQDLPAKAIEDRHLEAIAKSDFLYLVSPDGYLGKSASFEVGYAQASKVPVYSSERLDDFLLREYVIGVYSPEELVRNLNGDFFERK